MNEQWEYKVLRYELGWKGYDYDRIEQDLNELGREGWEAFDMISPSIGSAATTIVVILKRPRA
jgi:hypothetical protein